MTVHIRDPKNARRSFCGLDEPFKTNVFPSIDPPTCEPCICLARQDQLDVALAEVSRIVRLIGRADMDHVKNPEDGQIVGPDAPPEIFDLIANMQSSLGELLRAVSHRDGTCIIGHLENLESRRRKLVNACQTWLPELRISP